MTSWHIPTRRKLLHSSLSFPRGFSIISLNFSLPLRRSLQAVLLHSWMNVLAASGLPKVEKSTLFAAGMAFSRSLRI